MASHSIGEITRGTSCYSLTVHNRGCEGEYFVITQYSLDRTKKIKVNVGSKPYITKMWDKLFFSR